MLMPQALTAALASMAAKPGSCGRQSLTRAGQLPVSAGAKTLQNSLSPTAGGGAPKSEASGGGRHLRSAVGEVGEAARRS